MFNPFSRKKKEPEPIDIRALTSVNKDEIAKLLKTDKAVLEQFEKAYHESVLRDQETEDNLFSVMAPTAKAHPISADEIQADMIDRIVDELLGKTLYFEYDGKTTHTGSFPKPESEPVTADEIYALPKVRRPQLTGSLMHCDIPGESFEPVLYFYQKWLEMGNATPEGRRMYHMFRQGLDILDMDPVLYKIIGSNPNSMGFWFPALAAAAQKQDFFKVPKTRIVKVPMTLLQLTRNEYSELTATTRSILNQYCMKAFELDTNRDYFIKTGTYSSKFLFANAHVPAGKEVTELGEYLLFIHFQALQMASPLTQPGPIYGASTTTEWVVREYIKDTEMNPQIYQGMPLHTEYRVFIDCDTDKVLGIHPYWDPDIMKRRFSQGEDARSPEKIHDYIIFSAHEETIMERYEKNAEKVCKMIEAMLPDIDLPGQWSLDIMQNEDDFYLIDMGLAQNSALLECVPKQLLRPVPETFWVPKDMGKLLEKGATAFGQKHTAEDEETNA